MEARLGRARLSEDGYDSLIPIASESSWPASVVAAASAEIENRISPVDTAATYTPFRKPPDTMIPRGGFHDTRLTRYVLPKSINNFLKRPFANMGIKIGTSLAIGKGLAYGIPIAG